MEHTEYKSAISKNENEIRRYKALAKWLILIGLLVGVIALFSSTDAEGFASFVGGVVSTLWGLAGLILIYIAFLTQSNQLLTQQSELSQNLKEFEKQNQTMKYQQFENSFFKLIDNYQTLSNSFTIQLETGGELTGKKYFEELVRTKLSEEKYKAYVREVDPITGENNDREEDRYYTYAEFHGRMLIEHGGYLVPWIRSIEIILHYVDSSSLIPELQKPFYISVLRSQISPYEMVLICLDSMFSVVGNVRHQHLVKKYRLLTFPYFEVRSFPTLEKLLNQYTSRFDFFDEHSSVEEQDKSPEPEEPFDSN